MRTVLALLLLSGIGASDEPVGKPAPKIDYKLQFEMRTAEMQYQAAQFRLREADTAAKAKADELQRICGDDFTLGVDQKTTEYVCQPKAAAPSAK